MYVRMQNYQKSYIIFCIAKKNYFCRLFQPNPPNLISQTFFSTKKQNHQQ